MRRSWRVGRDAAGDHDNGDSHCSDRRANGPLVHHSSGTRGRSMEFRTASGQAGGFIAIIVRGSGAPSSDAMLIYSMGVSVDGFIADRDGAFAWTVPSEEQFRFHLAQTGELGGFLCGRRLYETMLPWETDPAMRHNALVAAFADVWCAIPKVVFSRTLDSVQGNARLAEASLAEEVAAALAATDRDVAIGGAGLAAAAIELGLVDELRVFRNPIVVGGGTPFLPPVTRDVPLDLIETRTLGSRVIYERYRRVR